MSEKLSERPIRQEKVGHLKARLIEQINELLRDDIEALGRDRLGVDDSFARTVIDEAHTLYVLRDYLNVDSVFMRAHAIYESQDEIVYRINENTIDWMLREDNLLNSILFHIERCGKCAEVVLNEEFFEYTVFGIMDRVAWGNTKE